MKKILTFILLMVLVKSLFSQELDIGNFHYENGRYRQAREVYENILKQESINQDVAKEALRMKALVNYHDIEYTSARIDWKAYISRYGYDLTDVEIFHYVQLIAQWKEYDEAEEAINEVDDMGVKKRLMEMLSSWRRSYVPAKKTVAIKTNIAGIEKGVGIAWMNGDLLVPTLYDAADEIPKFVLNRYKVDFDANFILEEQNYLISEGLYFVATPMVYNEGLYFSSDKSNLSASISFKGVTVGSQDLLKLFRYTLNNKKPEKPKLFYQGEKEYNYSFPYMVSDSLLLFATDQNGEQQGFDIMFAIKTEDGWSDPINLPEVNTRGNEIYPMVKDGKFYFSSDGHLGQGGMDVFVGDFTCENNGIKVENIQNLQQPINSKNDDFSLIYIDDKSGYFMSNRFNIDNDHIYWFDEDAEEIYLEQVKRALASVDFKKDFLNQLDKANINSRQPRYFSMSERSLYVSYTTGNKAYNADSTNNTTEENVTRKFIYFDFDKSALSKESKERIQTFINSIDKTANYSILVEGHSDSAGTPKYNMNLSGKRSMMVSDYLVGQGIDIKRIKIKNYGDKRLLVKSCENWSMCDDEENGLNRRVELNAVYE